MDLGGKEPLRRTLVISLVVALLLVGPVSTFGAIIATPIGQESEALVATADPATVYASSEYFREDFVELTITDDGKIRINGRCNTGAERFALLRADTDPRVFLIRGTIAPDGTFSGEYDATPLQDSETIRLWVSFAEKGSNTYWSRHKAIRLSSQNGVLRFAQSPMYEANIAAFAADTELPPGAYLSIDVPDAAEREAIVALAVEIVAGITDEHEKLLRIHDWVAENIYYDWDTYRSGGKSETSAYATLTNKMSVCQGYATLTQALLRSVGIPARIVSGHALGASAGNKYWDDVDHSKSNHAWNEAFVDGRWVIVDTTWDSQNRYENGQFNKGSFHYVYFDPSMQAFSQTHKIMTR
jgi:transglutaminase-like putative cysteine protease